MSTNILVTEQMDTRKAGDSSQPDLIVILDSRVRGRLKIAAVIAAAFGLALLAAPFVFTNHPIATGILSIAGVSVVLLAILFYYVSPSKFLRSDVSDAMCITGAEFVREAVRPMASGNECVYLPPGPGGKVHILVPYPRSGTEAGTRDPGNGLSEISITPPGYGLLEHAKRLGATFTRENLEDEVRDVMVNGFELADRVKLTRNGDSVTVEMRNIAASMMCGKLRKGETRICDSIGCPICSFATCMVVEGTGQKAIIDSAKARGRTIWLSLRLM